MTDEQQNGGAPGGWQPIAPGDYEEATAFVQLPDELVEDYDGYDGTTGSPLAAPGHGYVPPQIEVPLAAEPGGTDMWGMPGTMAGEQQTGAAQAGTGQSGAAQPATVHWPDPNAIPSQDARQHPGDPGMGQPLQDPYGYDAEMTPTPGAGGAGTGGPWHFGDESEDTGEPSAGHPDVTSDGPSDVTGQWSIPVARGDLPDETGEFTASVLAEQWGGVPPTTLPGGATAPWATGAETGQPWGAEPQQTGQTGTGQAQRMRQGVRAQQDYQAQYQQEQTGQQPAHPFPEPTATDHPGRQQVADQPLEEQEPQGMGQFPEHQPQDERPHGQHLHDGPLQDPGHGGLPQHEAHGPVQPRAPYRLETDFPPDDSETAGDAYAEHGTAPGTSMGHGAVPPAVQDPAGSQAGPVDPAGSQGGPHAGMAPDGFQEAVTGDLRRGMAPGTAQGPFPGAHGGQGPSPGGPVTDGPVPDGSDGRGVQPGADPFAQGVQAADDEDIYVRPAAPEAALLPDAELSGGTEPYPDEAASQAAPFEAAPPADRRRRPARRPLRDTRFQEPLPEEPAREQTPEETAQDPAGLAGHADPGEPGPEAAVTGAASLAPQAFPQEAPEEDGPGPAAQEDARPEPVTPEESPSGRIADVSSETASAALSQETARPAAPAPEEAPAADLQDPVGAPDTAVAASRGESVQPPPQDGPGPAQDEARDQPQDELQEEPSAAPDEHPLASYVLRVNGTDRPVTDAWIGESLLYVLRERLGLAGAKDGCSQGECGACNVQVDGRLVASCLVPAGTSAGSDVRTVEGLAEDGRPSDVQRALADCGAVQCGFCVPGMAMTVQHLLEGNPDPTDLEARQALSGNLCRCSGYRGVLDAVRKVVGERRASAQGETAQPGERPGGDEEEPRIPHQAGSGTRGAGAAAANAPYAARTTQAPYRDAASPDQQAPYDDDGYDDDGGRA